jgi:hypothetical protein
MSKETFYFPHDCKARHDRKLVNLIMEHGMNGVGIYWCLIEMLYEENGYLPLEYNRIIFELRTDTNVLQSVISEFELFENDGVKFWSNSILDRLQERCNRSEKAKNAINKRWDKLKKHTNVLLPNNVRNTDVILEKNRILKNKKEYSIDFLSFYSTYPKQIAKADAWKAWQKLEKTRPPVTVLIEKINEMKKTEQWTKDSGQFIPLPAKWLNGARWEDSVKMEKGSW